VNAPAKEADILASSTLRHSGDHRARNTPFNRADPMTIPGGIAMPDIELLKRQLQRDVARGVLSKPSALFLLLVSRFLELSGLRDCV
jgi:hypothetical protein